MLARRLLANPQDAEDAVQEVFVEIWKAAPRFDPSIASARAFVSMIARRRIIDRGRSEQARARAIRTGAPLESYADLGPRDTRRDPVDADAGRLAAAVSQLRPEQQQTIRLSIGQGWSHQEISDRTGVPLGTVKTNLRRGLQRLRQIIEGVPDDAGAMQEAPR